jgi:hypothetical protein
MYVYGDISGKMTYCTICIALHCFIISGCTAGADGPYRGRGIYPVASLMNHSCVCNTRNIVTGTRYEKILGEWRIYDFATALVNHSKICITRNIITGTGSNIRNIITGTLSREKGTCRRKWILFDQYHEPQLHQQEFSHQSKVKTKKIQIVGTSSHEQGSHWWTRDHLPPESCLMNHSCFCGTPTKFSKENVPRPYLRLQNVPNTTSQDQTSQLQIVPNTKRPINKTLQASKCPIYKTSQTQNVPSLNTSQVQIVPDIKCPKPKKCTKLLGKKPK